MFFSTVFNALQPFNDLQVFLSFNDIQRYLSLTSLLFNVPILPLPSQLCHYNSRNAGRCGEVAVVGDNGDRA